MEGVKNLVENKEKQKLLKNNSKPRSEDEDRVKMNKTNKNS